MVVLAVLVVVVSAVTICAVVVAVACAFVDDVAWAFKVASVQEETVAPALGRLSSNGSRVESGPGPSRRSGALPPL